MKYSLDLKCVNDRENLIVFVHGLFGGEETWQSQKNDTIVDFLIYDTKFTSEFDIALFNYYSKPTPKFLESNILELIIAKIYSGYRARKNLSINEIAQNFEQELKYNCDRYKRIILAGHSMGGLVIKYFLLNSIDKPIYPKIALYVSIATPHDGSKISDFAQLLYKNKQIINLSGYDKELKQKTEEWAKLKDRLPRTIYIVGQADTIVKPHCAVSTESRDQNYEIIQVDHTHFSIVKPVRSNDVVVSSFKKECLISIQESTDIGNKGRAKVISTEVDRLIESYNYEEIESYIQELKANILNDVQKFDFFKRTFKSRLDEVYNYDQFIDEIYKSDYLLLYGIGGVGKSLTIRKALLNIIESYRSKFILFCDAKKWDNTLLLNEKGHSDDEYFKSMLRAFDCSISFSDLSRINILKKGPDAITKFLIIDGLNEIKTDEARDRILVILKQVHHDYGFKIIVITRNYDIKLFRKYNSVEIDKIDPIQLKELLWDKFGKKVEDYNVRNLEYLSIPFFMDIAIRTNNDKIKNYSSFISNHFFTSSNRVSDTTLSDISNLAYKAYQTDKIFLIPSKEITPKIQKNIVDKGILKQCSGGYEFEHQLIHEYFVAYKISKDKRLWNNRVFDMITLEDKRSFEVIQMTLEQIDDIDEGDEFLKSVYDWNFYAALHCLNYIQGNYSDKIGVALTLILSEKLFDYFSHTRMRIVPYIKPLIDKFQIDQNNILEVNTISLGQGHQHKELFYKVIKSKSSLFTNSSFKMWIDLFGISDGSLEEDQLATIIDENPILGWSCANVIKREALSITHENQLFVLYSVAKNDLHKWRIVHALGASSTETGIRFLFKTLRRNESIWISYGAVRSLIEIGLFRSNVSFLELILDGMFIILEEQVYDKSIMGEIRACLSDKVSSEKSGLILGFFEKCLSSDHQNFAEKELFNYTFDKFKKRNGL